MSTCGKCKSYNTFNYKCTFNGGNFGKMRTPDQAACGDYNPAKLKKKCCGGSGDCDPEDCCGSGDCAKKKREDDDTQPIAIPPCAGSCPGSGCKVEVEEEDPYMVLWNTDEDE